MEEIKVKDVGTDQYDLTHLECIEKMGYDLEEVRMFEFYHKSDAAIGDRPGFLMVYARPQKGFCCGQISLDNLKKCLDKVGYVVVKKDC